MGGHRRFRFRLEILEAAAGGVLRTGPHRGTPCRIERDLDLEDTGLTGPALSGQLARVGAAIPDPSGGGDSGIVGRKIALNGIGRSSNGGLASVNGHRA